MNFDKLSLIKQVRLGGGGKTERHYYDYLINDRLLSEIIEIGDQIGVFGGFGEKDDRTHFNELLSKKKSELKSGRVPIYICPECGDLGCGCISIEIIKTNEGFIWKSFGFENNYENGIAESYDIGEFFFNKTQYYEELKKIT